MPATTSSLRNRPASRAPVRGPLRTRRAEVLPASEPLLSVSGRDGLQLVTLAEARSMAFEDFSPVRDISSYEGQAHLTGLYCFRGQQVPYRSVLHREALRILDFAGEVAALCIFPFYVHPGPRLPGRAPDFLAKLANGGLRVIDVRRRSHTETRTTQAELGPTRDACRRLRYEYRLVTEPDPLVLTNVNWLSLYRRQPLDYDHYRDTLLEACASGATIDELLDGADVPALVLPVLFHMLWRRELRVPLDGVIRGHSVITVDTRLSRGAG